MTRWVPLMTQAVDSSIRPGREAGPRANRSWQQCRLLRRLCCAATLTAKGRRAGSGSRYLRGRWLGICCLCWGRGQGICTCCCTRGHWRARRWDQTRRHGVASLWLLFNGHRLQAARISSSCMPAGPLREGRLRHRHGEHRLGVQQHGRGRAHAQRCRRSIRRATSQRGRRRRRRAVVCLLLLLVLAPDDQVDDPAVVRPPLQHQRVACSRQRREACAAS